jgi:hypothetical protein
MSLPAGRYMHPGCASIHHRRSGCHPVRDILCAKDWINDQAILPVIFNSFDQVLTYQWVLGISAANNWVAWERDVLCPISIRRLLESIEP